MANVEWHLVFLAADEEAKLRLRHLLGMLQEDPHVKEVETSDNLSEPEARGLIVRFHPDKDAPHNRAIQHLDKVYGTLPTIRRSKYARLMDDPEFDDL